MPNLRTAFTNIPPTVKVVAFIIIILSGLGTVQRVKRWQDNGEKNEENTPTFSSNILPDIALVPGFALQKFWTFLTAGFLETNLLGFLGSILVILVNGKYLERAWGSRDFLKFIGIVIIGANICTFLTYLCEYTITRDKFYLYNTQANGMIGLIGGLLVGLKQLIPEHLISLSLCRVKHIPSLFILLSFACFILFEVQSQFLLVFYGSFISWIYLRFYKYQDGLRGDRSETFSFASFFPEFIQPAVKLISTIVFNILVILKCCRPIQKMKFAIDLESLPTNHVPAMPGSARAESERRRAVALKALDARLHNKPNYYPTSPPPFTTSPSSYTTISPPNSSSLINNLNNETNTDNKTTNNVLFDAKDHLK
ncbi:eukaryotic integral membrane protein [Glomus cerebriforme]|uniref:Eukaryotic integral membrane protein n=1 Tax=Glomus cerebriforme TaxID=658196 RepID=A0A397T8E5_9GLOM|nr:eukaryotic integral membrane protein [Glomus cerebriforme]